MEPLSKSEIVERIITEHDALMTTINQLNSADMELPSVAGVWAVKDILAHLTTWEQLFLGWYHAGLHGDVPPVPGPGMTWAWKYIRQINEQAYQEHRDKPLEAVLQAFVKSFEETLATIQNINEADIHAKGRYAWTKKETIGDFIRANTYNHYRWANKLIRKWHRERTNPRKQAPNQDK